MVIDEIRFRLKDGREALLRSPREEDAEDALRYLRQSSGETEFVLRYPEEWDAFTVEGEKALLAQANAAPNNAMIFCQAEGRIVGSCQILFFSGFKTGHRVRVALSILRDYWDQGIGTRMFEEMIRLAKTRPQVTQMELEFIEGNCRARRLYEKLGFRTVGVHPDAIRLKNGRLLHEYLMIKPIVR